MRAVALLIAALGLGGVAWFARDAAFPGLIGRVTSRTPHEAYVHSLRRSGLHDTPLGREWIAAAARAVEQPLPVALPFERSIPNLAAQPVALGYRVTLKRGQRIEVFATVVGDVPAQAFVDVFAGVDDRATADAAGGLRSAMLEQDADGEVVFRIQPELLRSGQLRILARAAPALRFPVADARTRSVTSLFGDERDAGRRRHEGVDIFAKRGTPVLSASSGIVTRVNETAIGGRVVWVWDPSRSLTLYYAHLDTQAVSPGQRVSPGDVLGTVGNTGNARTTPPHLHFGIYEAGRGAIDPKAFIAG